MTYAIPHLAPVHKRGSPIAMPVVYFDDFVEGRSFIANNATIASGQGKFSELADLGDWLVTVVDGGGDNSEVIRTADDAAGGHLTLTTNDADNDSLALQLNGEAFAVADGKDIHFEIRLKGTDVSEFDWFVGLAITDTTPLAGMTDAIGFRCPDSTGDIDYLAEKDSTETTADSTKDLADATFVTLRFEVISNTRVNYYVDGNRVASITANIPDDEALTPTIEIRNDGAAANTMTVDYVYVMQER